MPRIAPGLDLTGFIELYGNEKLGQEVRDASRELCRDGGDHVHMKRLLIPLARARKRALRERRRESQQFLPPLNP